MIAVVAVAYGTQAPELGVAEFAPAAKQSLDAPPTTAPEAQGGHGAAGRRRPTTTTGSSTTGTDPAAGPGATAAPTTRSARTRPCFGDPPRQTEDPMSPACLATIFDGENGGSTSRGVSSTEIRIGVVTGGEVGNWRDTVTTMFEHLNQRFEFYGRRLVPVFLNASASNAVAARAVVADLAAQGVFGVATGLAEVWDAHAALPLELARQEVVTVTLGSAASWADRTLYDPWHPYVWSVYPSAEDLQSNLAAFACTSLVGHKARSALDPAIKDQTRKFGVISVSADTPPANGVLTRGLEECTGAAVTHVETRSDSASVRAALERLRSAGATTIFCICEDHHASTTTSNANAITFYPEWILTPMTWFGCEIECFLQSRRASSQVSPPMQLNAGPRLLPVQARPWFPVAQQVLTTFATASPTDVMGVAEKIYPELLVVASGIQGAGPALTAGTFAQALMSTQFPNPNPGQAPYWQPGAGFGPGDHSFYDDFNVAWWSDAADALEAPLSVSSKGSWCYLDQAARFKVGTYPDDADGRLFNPDVPCR